MIAAEGCQCPTAEQQQACMIACPMAGQARIDGVLTMARPKPMTLEEAKEHCKAGNAAHPAWFGKGWAMVYHPGTDGFYDRNPVTGSLTGHRFAERDECQWFDGQQPKELD